MRFRQGRGDIERRESDEQRQQEQERDFDRRREQLRHSRTLRSQGRKEAHAHAIQSPEQEADADHRARLAPDASLFDFLETSRVPAENPIDRFEFVHRVPSGRELSPGNATTPSRSYQDGARSATAMVVPSASGVLRLTRS